MMWLLLLISFGVTSCLLITLVIFDLLDPDRKVDKAAADEDEVVSTIMVIPASPPNDMAEDTTVQKQSRSSAEPASIET